MSDLEDRQGPAPVTGVGGEAGDAPPVVVGQPQLGAGVRPFTAGDDPHPGWPVLRAWATRSSRGRHPGGELGNPGAVTRLAVTIDSGPPRLLGDGLDRWFDGVLGLEPDRVLQPEVSDVVQKHLRAGAGVGTHQHLGAFVFGELGERALQCREVIGAVPRRGLPRPQVERANASLVPCSP